MVQPSVDHISAAHCNCVFVYLCICVFVYLFILCIFVFVYLCICVLCIFVYLWFSRVLTTSMHIANVLLCISISALSWKFRCTPKSSYLCIEKIVCNTHCVYTHCAYMQWLLCNIPAVDTYIFIYLKCAPVLKWQALVDTWTQNANSLILNHQSPLSPIPLNGLLG